MLSVTLVRDIGARRWSNVPVKPPHEYGCDFAVREDAESCARVPVGSARGRRESMEHVCDEGCEKECVLITEAEKSTIEVEVNGAWGMFVILQCVVVFIIWVAGTIMSRNATAGLDSFFPEMTHLREQQGQVWRW